MARALAILVVCLTALLPAWRGASAAAGPSGSPSTAVFRIPASDCGCSGACGMDACQCHAAPADPSPAEREPWSPGGRDSRTIVLGLTRATGGLVLDAPDRPARGPVLAARPAAFSYDSIQSYLCIWRS